MNRDWRLTAIAAWLAFFAVGQLVSVVFDTSMLWPFNPVSVYRSFSDDGTARSLGARIVTSEGERSAVSTGIVDHRVVRRFHSALLRAETEEERERVAELFFEFMNERREPGVEFLGARLYHFVWDLDQGIVTERRLLAEHMRP